MKKFILTLAFLFCCHLAYAYDLETLLEARYRNVEIVTKDGSKFEGYVWDVIKVIEDEGNKDKIIKYSINSMDIGKIDVRGNEFTSITRTKYYLIIRKGVVEYQVDSDNISLLGIQKW
jgi:hypothetical protein